MFTNDEVLDNDLNEVEDSVYDEFGDSQIQNADKWLDEHQKPDFPDLEALVREGTPIALEELREIAEKYNIEYGVETTPDELLQKIMWAMDESGDNESV